MIEVLGLAVRVIVTVLIETIGHWSFGSSSKYRDYLDTVPAGDAPPSKREWKAAGRPESAVTTTGP